MGAPGTRSFEGQDGEEGITYLFQRMNCVPEPDIFALVIYGYLSSTFSNTPVDPKVGRAVRPGLNCPARESRWPISLPGERPTYAGDNEGAMFIVADFSEVERVVCEEVVPNPGGVGSGCKEEDELEVNSSGHHTLAF